MASVQPAFGIDEDPRCIDLVHHLTSWRPVIGPLLYGDRDANCLELSWASLTPVVPHFLVPPSIGKAFAIAFGQVKVRRSAYWFPIPAFQMRFGQVVQAMLQTETVSKHDS